MSKKNFFADRRIIEIGFREQVKQTKKKGPQDHNKRDRNRKDEPEFHKVFHSVWVQSNAGWPKSKYYEHIPLGTEETPIEKKAEIYQGLFNLIEPNQNYKWPEFDTDYKRIKDFSHQYKGNSIVEAFEQVYHIPVQILPEVVETINNTPTELRVGEYVNLTIRSANKDGMVFDTMNLKQMVNSNVNLYRFENFKKFIPTEPIRSKVIAANPARITVDPLLPMLESWLNPIISNPNVQKVMENPQTIRVKDLRLTPGGFVGRAVIPNISKYVGEDYTIDAFIPGSQIVLNIERDFEKWNGKTVDAFVTSYIPKPGTINQMSLICSVKEQLKFQGEQNLIKLFNVWCDSDNAWEAQTMKKYMGVVTGIINSSKKCGVFVEIPELNITGMVNVPADQLTKYKPQDQVVVNITSIEEEMFYDDTAGQMRHVEPYVIKNGYLEKCSIKPVLKFAE